MVGGYTLVLLGHPPWPVVVLATSSSRRLRARAWSGSPSGRSAARTRSTLLVASFAVSYLLQNLAKLIRAPRRRARTSRPGSPSPCRSARISIPKLDVVTVVVTLVLLTPLGLFLQRTTSASRCAPRPRTSAWRGSSACARTGDRDGLRAQRHARRRRRDPARRADRVVTPDMGTSRCSSRSSPPCSAGMGSLRGAVLGGFILGMITVALQAYLPLELRSYRDAFAYAAVIAMLLVRPQGLSSPARRRAGLSAAVRRCTRSSLWPLPSRCSCSSSSRPSSLGTAAAYEGRS